MENRGGTSGWCLLTGGLMHRIGVLGLIWGCSFLFIKVAVEGMTPSTVAWARIALGAAVLYAIVRHRKLNLATCTNYMRHFVVMALFGSAIPFTMLAWGEQHITSALTAVLNASTALFTALIAWLAGAERLSRIQVAGLGVGMLGVAIAAGLGASDLEGSSIVGSGAAIGAGACYGLAINYARRHLTEIAPLVAATGQLLAGAVLLAPLALITSANEGVSLTPTRVLSIGLLGAVGTGIAFVIHYGNIGLLGATKASLVTYLVPVVAVVVGIVALSESFEWRLLIGGGVTVASIVAVTFGQMVRAAPADA